jgi:hypothetical protein
MTRKMHERTTRGIVNKGFNGMQRVVPRFNFSCALIGNRPHSLTGYTANSCADIRSLMSGCGMSRGRCI